MNTYLTPKQRRRRHALEESAHYAVEMLLLLWQGRASTSLGDLPELRAKGFVDDKGITDSGRKMAAKIAAGRALTRVHP